MIDIRLQRFQTPFAPSPDLRRNQIRHRNLPLPQMRQSPEMEIRTVGQNRQIRLLVVDSLLQPLQFAVDPGDMPDHLDQSDHRQRRGIDHRAHARPPASADRRSRRKRRRDAHSDRFGELRAYQSPEASPAEDEDFQEALQSEDNIRGPRARFYYHRRLRSLQFDMSKLFLFAAVPLAVAFTAQTPPETFLQRAPARRSGTRPSRKLSPSASARSTSPTRRSRTSFTSTRRPERLPVYDRPLKIEVLVPGGHPVGRRRAHCL